MDKNKCSCLLPTGICKSGFPVTIGCSPGDVKEYPAPICMNESVSGRLYPETGWPIGDMALKQGGGPK